MAILAIMNSSSPYGGVTSPSMMLNTATTPKCTGSMPSAIAVGSITGSTTRMMVEPSRKQPSTSRIRLTSSRKNSGDSSYTLSTVLTLAGMFSTVMT